MANLEGAKLAKLFKPSAGSCFHVWHNRRKVNLRTREPREADRLRRELAAGRLTPETIPGAPKALGALPAAPEAAPGATVADNASPAEALTAAFERAEAPTAPETAPAGPSGPANAPGGASVAPDAIHGPGDWHEGLGAAAGAGADPANDNPTPPGVEFDGSELLDVAAQAIAGLTESVARGVLAKRGRAAPDLDGFPLKPLLVKSWAAQLRIWCPTDAQMTPTTGIVVGTLGMWGIMAMGSQPFTPEQREAMAQAAAEKEKADARAAA